MIKYKTETIEKKVPEYVECDKCKTKYYYETNNEMEIQEFLYIRDIGGYASIWGDGKEINFDICQHCFKSWVDRWEI